MKTTQSGKLPFSTLLLFVIFCGVFPVTGYAWGSKGHQIIARIASQRLSDRARKGVADLLNGQSLESVSTWADLRGPHSAVHLVPIPLASKSYEPKQVCPEDRCLIEAIKKHRSTLEEPKRAVADRIEALKYLVHLIGDLHQPFHCADNRDSQGLQIKVRFNGRSTNLHEIWDMDMIEKARLTTDQYARQLGNTGTVAQSSYNVSRGTIVDWALESNKLATSAHVAGGDLGDKYYGDNKQVVDGQLYKAGVRLANILNDVFR